ncbi:hypothetical protein [Sulfurimicrobium lacus]|nr:hypothetical protein [Sulfurimicrobium lacus]
MAFMWATFPAQATIYFFPDTNPVMAVGEQPKWLKDGRGNDGYVSVVSEVIPESTCTPLSSRGFWGDKKTQLVLSVTTSGFSREQVSNEIPIATFDGRDDGSECTSLSTLPLNVIPLTLLGNYSTFNPGKLAIVLNVKSASNSSQDYIGSAKLVLGAAALVMTGGAASAIGGIAATVGNPVLSEAQNRTNNLLKGMANAKTTIPLSWKKLRSGLHTVEIPIYSAEGTLKDAFPDSSDEAVKTLQKSTQFNRTKLFTVRLTFNYVNSLFNPGSTGANDMYASDSLSTSNVLNMHAMHNSLNFMQFLNDSSPSLLQIAGVAEGYALSNACSTGFVKLKKLGLSDLDTAIVMKSFIDEAKGGGDWYANPQMVKDCFNQVPAIQAYLEELYGQSTPVFVIGDVQDGVGKAYKRWRDKIGPVLADFRRALTASQEQREVLLKFNQKKDIQLRFSQELQPWSRESTSEEATPSAYPGVDLLATRRIRTIGCFIYKDPVNLAPDSPGAYFLMEDLAGSFWLGNARLSSRDEDGKISTLMVASMTPDWANYLASFHYPGGECKSILGRYRSSMALTVVGRN